MTCILVVEDDTLREVLQEVLVEEAGFNVVAVSSADDAVSQPNVETLRLIVTDIDLPGRLDGIDLAIAALKSRPEVPIFVISERPGRTRPGEFAQQRPSFKSHLALIYYLPNSTGWPSLASQQPTLGGHLLAVDPYCLNCHDGTVIKP